MKVQHRVWSLALWISVFGLYFTLVTALPATNFSFDVGIASENQKYDASISSSSSINRHAWPPMKHHDIWNDVDANTIREELDEAAEVDVNNVDVNNMDREAFEYIANKFHIGNTEIKRHNSSLDEREQISRQSKVLHIFPVPVDGECLSDDGRRTGTCFNAYECRQKGGMAKGDCAMGFGVCCIFIANCNATVSNNITYLVSPQFPSFMPNNFTSCTIKIKLMTEDISQLRFDFNHFSLGQPNRRTGVCDGDVFNVSGGPGGTFSLCGQNSGQHIYYDVGGRALPRQTLYGSLRPPTLDQIYPNLNASDSTQEQLIEISMNFAQRFLPIRLWEIRIAQIPFSQRAPAGCLQYHLGSEGIIQTFNFADNGRHLANQHYRVCMRQEMEMCSIMYQPCDEQSFRIGPNIPLRETTAPLTNAGGVNPGNAVGSVVGAGSGGGGGGGGGGGVLAMPGSAVINGGGMLMMPLGVMSTTMLPLIPAMAAADDTTGAPIQMASVPAASMATPSPSPMPTTAAATTASIVSSTAAATTVSITMPSSASASAEPTMTTASTLISTQRTTPAATPNTTETPVPLAPAGPSSSTPIPSSTLATTPLSDDFEGSGDESVVPVAPSRRPRPVSGGFDLLGFLRSAFDISLLRRRSGRLQRLQRQIYSPCSDRITLPCIIEDFIGTGLGPLPSCEPVHCGNRFCSSGVWPCRIESTVTPFFMNMHFGDGARKGSAEDNIGACLRYTQMQCL